MSHHTEASSKGSTFQEMPKDIVGLLGVFLCSHAVLGISLDSMQCVVVINGKLNRAAWQRQKRVQPLKWARIGTVTRRR